MEREVRYCTTDDGVRIAYIDDGEGYPFVWLTWLTPVAARFNADTLTTAGLRYISFDTRGFGASQRNVPEISLDTQVRDIEAVVDHIGVRRFILQATRPQGQAAIAYAARHPARVSRLILISPFASGEARQARSRFSPTLASARASGDMVAYAAIVASLHAMTAADVLQQTTPEMIAAYEDARMRTDVSDLLAQVEAPTLVVHPTVYDLRSLAQDVAAGIPDARFVTVRNASVVADHMDVITEFLQGSRGGRPRERGGPTISATFRTVLFTDVVQNTELLQRIGDDAWRAVMREHEAIVRAALEEDGGTEISTAGDSFFASFASTTRALQCAVQMQRAFALRNTTAKHAVDVRIGLNAGEPIEDGKDLVGAAVTMAARIMSQATGGEILVSDVVRQLAAGKNFLFADRGEFLPKGFDDAVRLYEVRWRE